MISTTGSAVLRASAGADAAHRRPGKARHVVRQRSLPGATLQSFAEQPAHRTAAVVHRHLRFGARHPRCRLVARSCDFAADLYPRRLSLLHLRQDLSRRHDQAERPSCRVRHLGTGSRYGPTCQEVREDAESDSGHGLGRLPRQGRRPEPTGKSPRLPRKPSRTRRRTSRSSSPAASACRTCLVTLRRNGSTFIRPTRSPCRPFRRMTAPTRRVFRGTCIGSCRSRG